MSEVGTESVQFLNSFRQKLNNLKAKLRVQFGVILIRIICARRQTNLFGTFSAIFGYAFFK